MAEQESTSAPENPLTASVERLRRELDHWLEVAWQQGERALDKIGVRAGTLTSTPAVDVIETEEDVLVLVDLPGVELVREEVALDEPDAADAGETGFFEVGEDPAGVGVVHAVSGGDLDEVHVSSYLFVEA